MGNQTCRNDTNTPDEDYDYSEVKKDIRLFKKLLKSVLVRSG